MHDWRRNVSGYCGGTVLLGAPVPVFWLLPKDTMVPLLPMISPAILLAMVTLLMRI